MGKEDTFSSTAINALRAIELAKLNETPVSPIFYEFWYAVTSEADGAAAEFYSSLSKSGSRLSTSDVAELHARFFRNGAVLGSLIDSISDINLCMNDVSETLASVDNHMDAYNAGLETAAAKLGELPGDAANIARELMEKTKQFASQQYAVRRRIQLAQEQFLFMKQAVDNVLSATLIDHLTGLGTRQVFEATLQKLLSDERNRGLPLSLLLIDIDYFKLFNDTHGHVLGDLVISKVGDTVRNKIRGSDHAARYGGEEVAVLLPNTPIQGALIVAESIRETVSKIRITSRPGERVGPVTVSIGVAERILPAERDQLVKQADFRLYAAKRRGRNCVVSEGEPERLSEKAA